MGQQPVKKKNPWMIATLVCVWIFMSVAGFMTVSVQTARPANSWFCIWSGPPCVSGFSEAIREIIMNEHAKDFTLVLAQVKKMTMVQRLMLKSAWTSRTKQTTQELTLFLDNLWTYGMKPYYQKMTRQFDARDTDQIKAVTMFQDAIEMNRARLERQMLDLRVHNESKPSENVCVAATAVGGMTRVDILRNAYAVTTAPRHIARSAGRVASGSDADGGGGGGGGADKGTGKTAALTPATDVAMRRGKQKDVYCNPAENAGNAGCTTPGIYMDRDMDVVGEVFAKQTIEIGRHPELQEIIDDLLTNIAEPFIQPPVLESRFDLATGRAAMEQANKHKTRRQAVYDLMYYVVARRLPGSVDTAGGGKTFLNEIRGRAGNNMHNLNYVSDNPSHNEIMNVMMSERFRTPDYNVAEIDHPTNNRRERVVQQAFQLMQMSDTLDILDRYSVLLAARLGDNINRYKTPEVPTGMVRPASGGGGAP